MHALHAGNETSGEALVWMNRQSSLRQGRLEIPPCRLCNLSFSVLASCEAEAEGFVGIDLEDVL
jgi:hypothetical protein